MSVQLIIDGRKKEIVESTKGRMCIISVRYHPKIKNHSEPPIRAIT